jgi:hypothetical protein
LPRGDHHHERLPARRGELHGPERSDDPDRVLVPADPRLEPGLSEATRSELVAADIAYLVVIRADVDTFWAVGLDGTLREL